MSDNRDSVPRRERSRINAVDDGRRTKYEAVNERKGADIKGAIGTLSDASWRTISGDVVLEISENFDLTIREDLVQGVSSGVNHVGVAWQS